MIDPVTLAILRGRLEQIADEMDATLFRSAFTRRRGKSKPSSINITPGDFSTILIKFEC